MAIATLAFSATFSVASHAQQAYTALDLGNLAATDLNDLGQVAGFFYTPDGEQSAVTGPNGIGLTMLSLPDGSNRAEARGINNQGTVAGWYALPASRVSQTSTGWGGFVVAPGSSTSQVVTSDLGPVERIVAINNAGQVAGRIGANSVVFNLNTGATQVISGLAYAWSEGMNDLGMVVGQGALQGNYTPYAFVTDAEGHAHVIQAPDGMVGTYGTASAINNHGWVVGRVMDSDERTHAVLSKDGQSFIDMLPDTFFSVAHGINDAGQVVGTMDDLTGWSHGFITATNGGDVIDLNQLAQLPGGNIIIDAYNINEAGQILVVGSNFHTYLLTPTVPEPGMAWLGLLGLGGVMLAVRRHKG